MIRFWDFVAHRCPAAAELGRSAKKRSGCTFSLQDGDAPMKSTTIILLALLLLMAAVVILQPILVAQPPDGGVAQPSTTLTPFAVGIVALGVLSSLSMKILSGDEVNSTETKLEAVEFTDSNPSCESVSDRLAPSICWIGVFLSGLLIVATMAAAILSLSPGHDEGGRGMAIGILYFMV